MFLSFTVPEVFICGYFQKCIALTDEQSRLKNVVLILSIYYETITSTICVLWSTCLLQILKYYETILVLFPMRNGEDPKHYHNLLSNKISPTQNNEQVVCCSLCKGNHCIFLVVEDLWFKFLVRLFIFPWFSLEICWPSGYCPSVHSAFLLVLQEILQIW